MKPPRRQFLHLAAAAAALPGGGAPCLDASLSDAAGSHHRRTSHRHIMACPIGH
jgi:hypothetical protein